MPGARDGQLRVRRGADSPPWGLDLYDDEAGIYRAVGGSSTQSLRLDADVTLADGTRNVIVDEVGHAAQLPLASNNPGAVISLLRGSADAVMITPAPGDILAQYGGDIGTLSASSLDDNHIHFYSDGINQWILQYG